MNIALWTWVLYIFAVYIQFPKRTFFFCKSDFYLEFNQDFVDCRMYDGKWNSVWRSIFQFEKHPRNFLYYKTRKYLSIRGIFWDILTTKSYLSSPAVFLREVSYDVSFFLFKKLIGLNWKKKIFVWLWWQRIGLVFFI